MLESGPSVAKLHSMLQKPPNTAPIPGYLPLPHFAIEKENFGLILKDHSLSILFLLSYGSPHSESSYGL